MNKRGEREYSWEQVLVAIVITLLAMVGLFLALNRIIKPYLS